MILCDLEITSNKRLCPKCYNAYPDKSSYRYSIPKIKIQDKKIKKK